MSASAVASTTPANVPKGPNVPHISGIHESRVQSTLGNTIVNRSIHARHLELKKEMAPFRALEKALETKKEHQYDANGEPMVDTATGKDKLIDLTEAREAEIRAHLEANAESYTKLRNESDALSRARIRFSENVGNLVRDIVMAFIKELIEVCAKECIRRERKIMLIDMLHTVDATQLQYYRLIHNLPSWVNPPKQVTTRKKKSTPEDDAAAAAAAAVEASVKPPQPKPVAGNEPNFVHYIDDVIKGTFHPIVRDANGNAVINTTTNVDPATGVTRVHKSIERKSNGEYAALRTSQQLKEYLSKLVLEFMDRLSPLIQRQLQALKIKTVGESVIMSIVEMLMSDGVPVAESLKYSTSERPDPVELKKLKDERKAARAAGRDPTDTRTEAQLPKIVVVEISKELVFGSKDAPNPFDALKVELAEARKLWPQKKVAAKK